MNKVALIHHDNVPSKIKKLFQAENMFRFEYLAGKHQNLDTYISNEIIDKLKNKDIDILFIKDNLSTNYLELYGISVAYHIRLSETLKDMRFIPIIILSDIDGYTLNKIEPIAKILFTKNIFLAPSTKETIDKYIDNTPRKLSENEYRSGFLDPITVESSENTTNHSIANQWAIYRWAEYLNAKSEAITKNENKIISMLYFKYLNVKYPLPKKNGIRRISTAPQPVLSEKYKILYIDDEWAKGWADILDTYFSKSESIDFKTYQYNFIDKTQDQIIDYAIDKIKTTDPDLILLDLRLSQSDHTEKNIDNLTGIRLIDQIHSINKGIQVIMLSATGKSLTLEKMHEKEILGYIKKDRPGDLGLGVANNYDRLKNLTIKGIEKKYLKKIWLIQKNILTLDIFTNNKQATLGSEIKSIFDILDSNMKNKFNFTILSFAKSLETISNFFINEHVMKYIDDNTNVGIYNAQNNTIQNHKQEKWHANIENRLHNIMHKKLNIVDKKKHILLCELINCRNYIVHPKKKTPNGCDLITNPDEKKIVEWFELIFEIVTKIR